MTADSRFRSPRVQSAVVGLTMLLLLIGSTALAAQFGAARAPQAAAVAITEVTAGDLRFQLPSAWRQVPTDPSQRSAAIVWADPNRPARRLGLVRVHVERPIDPRIVIQRYVPMFMGPRATQAVQTVDAAVHPHPELNVFEWAGASDSGGTDEPRLHLAADLTGDFKTHYLLYLTDEVQPGDDGRTVLLRNLALLRAVHLSATLITPAPTPTP